VDEVVFVKQLIMAISSVNFISIYADLEGGIRISLNDFTYFVNNYDPSNTLVSGS